MTTSGFDLMSGAAPDSFFDLALERTINKQVGELRPRKDKFQVGGRRSFIVAKMGIFATCHHALT
jgi:hypothetical protein